MKKIFFIAVLAILFIYLGCNKADKGEPAPAMPSAEISSMDATPGNPNGEVVSRETCTQILTSCNCAVTTDINVQLEICGNLPDGQSSCSFTYPCGGLGISSSSGDFIADETREFCVLKTGSICILNTDPTNDVEVTVQFGSSTPVDETIGAQHVVCFHTNNSCSTTVVGCP